MALCLTEVNIILKVIIYAIAHLQAYCDADWAGDPSDIKSTTGFVILLNNTPVSWCSKNKMQYLGPLQKLSTGVWLTPRLSYSG